LQSDRLPRTISFKTVLQILKAIQPFTDDRSLTRQQREDLYEQILDAIAAHRVGHRPDRFEPRLRKRRFKKYDYMMKPRYETKLEILKQLKSN